MQNNHNQTIWFTKTKIYRLPVGNDYNAVIYAIKSRNIGIRYDSHES
jgi:hypothetical protein